MAEHLEAIEELQKLPDGTHIFCPQASSGVSTEAESRQRRTKFFSALPLLAYDGNECIPYHKWLYETLDSQLSGCEACIRHYYLGKVDLKQQLLQEYDEDEVQQFLEIISRRDIARIRKGLDATSTKLESLPLEQRKPNVLENSMLFAFYETLHCPAFFTDEQSLSTHFDRPFRMVQTHKELKIKEILPAVTKFLFSTNQYRLNWAVRTWERLGRELTDEEWEWAIQDILKKELDSIHNDGGLERFWSSLRLIVQKLNAEQIRVKLFDMGFNFAKLSLDHLAKRTMTVREISATLAIIWSKEPNAYWDALPSVSPTIVAEQFFNSPNFDKALEQQFSSGTLQGTDVLGWIQPFLSGLLPANRPPAARTLVQQLLNRVKSEKSSQASKIHCYRTAVECLKVLILAFSDNEKERKAAARPVISDALSVVASHLSMILDAYDKYPDAQVDTKQTPDTSQNTVAVLVRNSLALDCQMLKFDYENISTGSQKATNSSYTPELWKAMKTALSADKAYLSMAFVRGTIPLLGLEPFRIKDTDPLKAAKESFNSIFGKVEDVISQCVDRFSDYPASHLDHLFESQDCNMATMALLFSGNETIYLSIAEIFKTIAQSPDRVEALRHVLDAFLSNCLYAICWVFRRIVTMMPLRPIPRLLSTVNDVVDLLCDSPGLLRARDHSNGITQSELNRERHAIQAYWSYSWQLLTMIFTRMEKWSIDHGNRELMTEVCRNTMQHAKSLFNQYYVFLNVARAGEPDLQKEKIRQLFLNTNTDTAANSGSPVKAFYAMVKWLRLKDTYLAETLASLITEMLGRLKEFGCQVPQDNEALKFVEDVAVSTSGKGVKTILNSNQKAELIRALETYTGKQIALPIHVKKKQQKLDLRAWTDQSKTVITIDDESDDKADSKPSISKKPEQGQLRKPSSLATKSALQSRSELSRRAEEDAKKKAFIEQRKKDQAIAEKRRAELAAKNRGKGGSEHTANAGSGLTGLGVQGKDHSLSRSDLMVSSESEDSDSESNDELFGASKTSSGTSTPLSRASISVPMPIKKVKQVRSAKDMRARLSPDLTNLHKTILAWDFFVDTDTPPNSNKSDYTLVTNKFRTVQDYQNTFEPLLVLEGWQTFRHAREEGTFKCFELKIASSLIVDNFFEVNSTVPMLEGKDLGLGASDLVLLSKGKKPHQDKSEPHCFARVKEITRKRGEIQITYRVNSANNPMRQHLHDKATIYAAIVSNLTTLEREYGALMALPYYDLVDEIINAKPSPLLDYSDAEVDDIRRVHNLNTAQAKAVRSAVDNDAFTLVQGPPGSGKTKTITAILSAIMTGTSSAPRHGAGIGPPPANKKILVAAPSNAAVDELVMRFKDGIRLNDGRLEKINVVRLGRSEAINTTVKDVTLEELVTKRLEETAGPTKGKEDVGAVMMEHKAASTEMIDLRTKMDETRQKGGKVSDADDLLFEALKRKKTTLSAQIDQMKEKQNTVSRDADITRRRIEQDILDKAHVICSTLSGSGQEKVQSLNVEFETVIIDEAAQSIELSALIPLKYGCSKCILVGDPKQLPPTVLSREAAKYQYEQSLFARMEANHKKDVHLLDTQYRMHPHISAFPSKTFYDSKLRDGPDMARLRARPWHGSPLFGPYRFFDVQGLQKSAPKGRSLVNEAEIEMALAMYDRLVTDVPKYDFNNKVGIITPYKGQLKALKEHFRRAYGEGIWNKIDFNTTDAFQGRESEIIIFSCVRASTTGIGFLKDIRRMNVALTRAKCSLWVLGNTNALKQGEFWNALIEDSKARNVHTAGNTLQLFSKPILTPDMMIEDADMEGMDESKYETAQSAADSPANPAEGASPASVQGCELQQGSNKIQVSHDSSTTNGHRTKPEPKSVLSRISPASDARSTESSDVPGKGMGLAERGKHTGYGQPGLNTNANCAICGSNEHYSKSCDNTKAKEARGDICNRCGQAGHFRSSCSTTRCLACGDMGHAEANCKTSPAKRLTQEIRKQVEREENMHKTYREEQRLKRAQRQLGEHGAGIPTIKSDNDVAPKRKRDLVDEIHNGHKSSKSFHDSEPEPKREKKPPLGPINKVKPGGPPLVRKKRDDASAMFAKKR